MAGPGLQKQVDGAAAGDNNAAAAAAVNQYFPQHYYHPDWIRQQQHLYRRQKHQQQVRTPDHLLLNSAPNLGPLISRWKINKFENCSYKSVRILEVLKLLLQQFLSLSSSQRDVGGPILGDLMSNIR
jgi:hypothetical protein